MFNLVELITTSKSVRDEDLFEMPDTYYGEVEYEEMLERYRNYRPAETNTIVQPSFHYFFGS